MFLSAEAPLGSDIEWQGLQPMHSSMLENVSRLPKQLLGVLRLPGISHAAVQQEGHTLHALHPQLADLSALQGWGQ